MDLLKTKIYLDKLNREFARLSKDPDNIVRIDVDIVASYVRQLYDAVLSDATTTVAAPVAPPVPTRRPAAPRPPQIEEPAPIPAIPMPPPPPTTVVPEPPPVRETPAPRPAAQPPVVVEEKPAPAAPSEPEVVHVKTPVTHVVSADAEALFEEKQARELSEKLSELPIADLKKSIALNDRLLLTRELFSGDGQAFDAALTALNSYTQFADAKTYLLDHCVVRYGWLDKKRVETAKNFIKLVRRRYK